MFLFCALRSLSLSLVIKVKSVGRDRKINGHQSSWYSMTWAINETATDRFKWKSTMQLETKVKRIVEFAWIFCHWQVSQPHHHHHHYYFIDGWVRRDFFEQTDWRPNDHSIYMHLVHRARNRKLQLKINTDFLENIRSGAFINHKKSWLSQFRANYALPYRSTIFTIFRFNNKIMQELAGQDQARFRFAKRRQNTIYDWKQCARHWRVRVRSQIYFVTNECVSRSHQI